jgi:hypothetical protein
MSDQPTRPVLLLDDDGEMFNALDALERIVVELIAIGDEDQEPTPEIGPDQLNAVHRVLRQLHAAERSPGVDLYDPSGTFQYGTLRVFCPLVTDLEELGRSLQVVRVASQSPHPHYIRETVEDITQRLAIAYAKDLDRAYQTLKVDAGSYGRLCELASEYTGKLVLDIDDDAVYRAYVENVVRLRGSDPLEWFLYLG